MLWVIAALLSAPGGVFLDDDGHWAEPYIEAAAEAGRTVGVEAGYYDPDGPVTRDQAGWFLDLPLHGHGHEIVPRVEIFEALGGVDLVIGNGWAVGCTPTDMCLGKPLSRAEMAVLIVRMDNLIPVAVPPRDPPCFGLDLYQCWDRGWLQAGAPYWSLGWSHLMVSCESGWVPDVRNSASATGLGQIIDSTWAALRVRHPDLGPDRRDPYTNAVASGYLYVDRGSNPWNESRSCWG